MWSFKKLCLSRSHLLSISHQFIKVECHRDSCPPPCTQLAILNFTRVKDNSILGTH